MRTLDLFNGGAPVRALSWKNPFAELMLHGKVETRSWDTKYRGLVLICASKKAYTEMELIGISGEALTQKILNRLTNTCTKERNGYAIAIGILHDVYPMSPADENKCFVKYDPKLYCHLYTNVMPIEPFEWKGRQGWKTLTEEEIKKIKILTNDCTL